MGYEAVLRHIETHGHSRGIARSDFKINVGKRAVEGKFAGIRDRLASRRALIGKPEQVTLRAFLKARRVGRKNKSRSLRAVTDKPDPRPNMNRPADPVAPCRNKDNAVVGSLLHAVNRMLQRIGIVEYTISMRAKIQSREINGMRIIRPRGVNRLCGSITEEKTKQEGEKQNDLIHTRQSHPLSVSNAIRIHRKGRRSTRLAVFAVQKIAHRFPARGVPLAISLGAVAFHARLIGRARLVGGAAFRATGGKARFIGLQLKLFSTNNASFDRKNHTQ